MGVESHRCCTSEAGSTLRCECGTAARTAVWRAFLTCCRLTTSQAKRRTWVLTLVGSSWRVGRDMTVRRTTVQGLRGVLTE